MSQGSSEVSSYASDGKMLQWLPWLAGTLAIILVLSYAIAFHPLPINERPDAWGQFGDYMGGLLNPLISLFTLIVAVSVWRLQKTELLETRKALEEQGKTAEQQRREQRFFDLLNLYRATLDSIVIEISDVALASSGVYTFTGKRAFTFLISHRGGFGLPPELQVFFHPTGPINLWERPPDEEVTLMWDERASMLDHYFRVIFTLLREAEPLLQNDRCRYIKILRAQLSRDEINLIAMNLLYDEEGKKMRELVAEYGFLKHLPHNNLRDIAEKKLPPLSFGREWATNHLLAPPQVTPC